MSSAPSMPLFPDAYLADTTHLSTEEHGAYFLLLMAMWRRGGAVPNDDKDLARIVGLSNAKWLKIKSRLMSFLIIENNEISQKRLKKEWIYVQEKRQKNAKNGSKGGRPKPYENNEIAKANGFENENPNESPHTQPHTHIEKEEDKSSSKSLSKKTETDEFLTAYFSMAERSGLAMPRAISVSRRARITAKIKAHGLPVCLEAVQRVGQSNFCTGINERGWKADLDFVLQDKSFLGLIEGKYDNREPVSQSPPRKQTMADFTGALLRQMTEPQGQNHESDHHNRPAIEGRNAAGDYTASGSAVQRITAT